MRLTGRDFVLHVAQRARAGERTCWRIEEEQDRIANAAWADWNQGREVRADDILLQQTNVAAAQIADRTAAPMMCIGREERDERKRLLLADLSRGTWQDVIEVPVDGTSALLCRLRAAGIFVQKHITIDDQLHPHAIPRFDETSAEPVDHMQLQFWCCAHEHCERVLTVGRDGVVNENLLRFAEQHVQHIHGETAFEP